MRKIFTSTIIFWWSGILICQSQNLISSIEFQGLDKTNSTFLNRYLSNQNGQFFKSDVLQKDYQSLLNLDLFYDLEMDTMTVQDTMKIIYSGKEKLSVLPIFGFGGIRENFWIQVGGMDVNFRGRGERLLGYYTYYDRHSFLLNYVKPFIGRSNFGLSLVLQKLSTLEPLYFKNLEATYEYDNLTLEVLPGYNFGLKHKVHFGFAYLREKYFRVDPVILPELPSEISPNKWILKSKYQYGRLNYYSNFVHGFDNHLFLEGVLTTKANETFWKVLNVSRFLMRIGERGNWANRLRLGFSGNTESPFVPFVLDSYINIRGSGNRVARGIGEIVFNTEYRHNFREWPWGAVQGVLFWDAGGWRPVGKSVGEIFRKENITAFAGLGGRVYFKEIYNFIFRVDYGINLTDHRHHGVVIGVGQYF